MKLDAIKDSKIIDYIYNNTLNLEELVKNCVNKVKVSDGNIEVEINTLNLRSALKGQLGLNIPKRSETLSYALMVPFSIRRAHKGTIILKPDNDESSISDLPPAQLKNLIRGVVWRDEHFAGTSLVTIARRENLSKSGVRKIIMGSFDTLMSL